MKFISIAAAIFLAGCASALRHTPIAADLIGHTTGGRESSWKFMPGQVRQFTVITPTDVSVIVESPSGRFFQILRLTYRGNKLVNVGQLYIQKL
jgi:hypothetical protein